MARLTKQILIDALKKQNVALAGDESFEALKALIAEHAIQLEDPSLDDNVDEEEDEDNEGGAQSPEEFGPGVTGGSQPFEPRIPLGSKARAMKDQLAKQPKVRVYIPLSSGEKQGVTQSVVLNGYPMYIRKGMYVEVPKSVAEVLEVKLQHKMSIENHPSRISGDDPVKMTTYGN